MNTKFLTLSSEHSYYMLYFHIDSKQEQKIEVRMKEFNDLLYRMIWGDWLLYAFLGTGLYFTIGTRFFQIRGMKKWMFYTFGKMLERKEKKVRKQGEVTQFQALCTALGGTLGTGNIVGVATALTAGGSGAIVWMWISAWIGMMTSFAEKTLGILFRYPSKDGTWVGGPMVYMERGLHSKGLAIFFSIICILASFGMGNMTQAHSITEAFQMSVGGKPLIIGIFLAFLLGIVFLGGMKRLIGVTEKLVPFIAIFYLIGSCIVIFHFKERLFPAIGDMICQAFQPQAVVGGVSGYGIKKAMTIGISRGIFSNEAGLGSSVIIHSQAEVQKPSIQGFWGIQEVFLDTIIMCTLTALVILTSGAYDGTDRIDGTLLVTQAFGTVLGSYGAAFIRWSMILFGFATLISWSYYGKKCVHYLVGEKWVMLYEGIYCGIAVIGSTLSLETVWKFADNMNGLLAIPNLIAIVLLSPYVFRELKRFEKQENN